MEAPKRIYQNEHFLILDKPSGLLVHPTLHSKEKTLVDWLLENYPEIRSVGESYDHGGKSGDQPRPGIVHRLDRETSGLLVVARTQTAFEKLKKLFQERSIIKKYYALVWGDPSLKASESHGRPDIKSGRIEKDIAPFKGRRRTVEAYSQQVAKKPRAALTEWEVQKYIGENFSLLSVRPITGRTHQIRVHLASIGHPVVCDRVYARKKVCPPELGRLFLHAYFLSFAWIDGTLFEFESPLPKELSEFVKQR